MLRFDDNGDPKLNEDRAVTLIGTLRTYAIDAKNEKKGSREGFDAWQTLMTAAAELERFYLRAGIIPDERKVAMVSK